MNNQSNSSVKSLDEISLEIAKNGKTKDPGLKKQDYKNETFLPDEEVYPDESDFPSGTIGKKINMDIERTSVDNGQNKREELEVMDSDNSNNKTGSKTIKEKTTLNPETETITQRDPDEQNSISDTKKFYGNRQNKNQPL